MHWYTWHESALHSRINQSEGKINEEQTLLGICVAPKKNCTTAMNKHLIENEVLDIQINRFGKTICNSVNGTPLMVHLPVLIFNSTAVYRLSHSHEGQETCHKGTSVKSFSHDKQSKH